MLAVGSQAPDFTLPELSGPEYSLKSFSGGQPVLLAIYKVSCPTCQLTLPFLDRLRQSQSLKVLTISQDTAKDTALFRQTLHVSVPTLLDSKAAGYPVSNAYAITNVPSI